VLNTHFALFIMQKLTLKTLPELEEELGAADITGWEGSLQLAPEVSSCTGIAWGEFHLGD
jgi:hypothetical protein